MSDKKIRRLGTWDSRKPGQSPKEMKKLLEKADDTLKKTRMGPERQGLNDRRYPTNYNSENMKFIRDHNASAKKIIQTRESNYRSFGEPQYGSPEYDMDAHDEARREDRRDRASEKRLTRRANKVKDTVSINRIPPSFNRERAIQKSNVRKKQIMNTSFSTRGKQRILEGGSPKRSITARAGAGLGWLKRKYLSYGASQWRKSKTH